ncbi:SDR family NAD(P)-dependent oxidoreductase [Microtetraspora malaysiensis]|uniref:SDR family NAD(P)-dependent oxidoreductase n=1 Tax=Microtetraspora malaysiensis TaxID=161358 RepID=UPI003D941BD9
MSASSVVLITGAATGIGNLTARLLAAAGHTVYASMRDVTGRNAGHAAELVEAGQDRGHDLRVVELDVTSQESADNAVAEILDATGRLDTVVHNAGHLYIGYVEAFTDDDIARVLALPAGSKPFRSVVDAANVGVDHVMAFSDQTREAFVRRLGFAETLEVKR